MPITLPTTTSSSSTSPSTPSSSINSNPFLTTLKSRLLRPLDFSTTLNKSAAAIVLLRAVANAVHFVMWGLASRGNAWCLYYLLDQLVITYCVNVIAEARGDRRVPGVGVRVGERFFEFFLVVCGMVHVLYMLFLVALVVSWAIFFGVTGGTILTVIGAIIVLVAVLASLPEDEEGGLSIV